MKMSCNDHVKYVRMPWDDKTSIIYQDDLYTKWNLIQKLLGRCIPDIDSLVNVIMDYNVVFGEDGSQAKPQWSFRALREVVRLMDDQQRGRFFGENGVLQTIQKLALLLSDACQKLKWLVIGTEDSLTLHQMQVASILANAFFCTFPKRGRGEPSINFNTLFDGNARHVEKLKCLIHYFSRIHDKQPNGYITFHRRCTREDEYPRWDRTSVMLCSITADDVGGIEDQAGYLQMDFANRTLGGGVLGFGCVQEEIRFVICPELIAARLFTEPMTDNEACIIIGAERFCNYSGYADNFQFLSDYQDNTPFDQDQRRNVHILAVDATNFRQSLDQYRESRMLRDIKKIYTGLALRPGDVALPLATGNWGCGVYRGDPELKSLLQIMAASQVGRSVAYFTFGNQELKNNILRTHGRLQELNITVGQLYRILARYIKDRRSNQTVFNFVTKAAADYVNAYTVARNPVVKDERNSDSAFKRSSQVTPVQNLIQSASKLPRKDLPAWPRAWLEKEKHKDKPRPAVFESNSMESDFDSDDFIPATPDQKQPAVSLLDALEEQERLEQACDMSFVEEGDQCMDVENKGELGVTSLKNPEIVANFNVGSPSQSPVCQKTGTPGKKLAQTKIDNFFKK